MGRKTGFFWSFNFLTNVATGNWKISEFVQLQPVVWSFAVGFSSILVFFSVQQTGPANTSLDLGDSYHHHHYKNPHRGDISQTHYHQGLESESRRKLVLMKVRGWYGWMVNCERKGAYSPKFKLGWTCARVGHVGMIATVRLIWRMCLMTYQGIEICVDPVWGLVGFQNPWGWW